jgi:hypothetical protein
VWSGLSGVMAIHQGYDCHVPCVRGRTLIGYLSSLITHA